MGLGGGGRGGLLIYGSGREIKKCALLLESASNSASFIVLSSNGLSLSVVFRLWRIAADLYVHKRVCGSLTLLLLLTGWLTGWLAGI